MIFLRGWAIIFFLLNTTIFHVSDPQTQEVRANKFKHQYDGQRRDYRDGNKRE
jgi:hypothetical protein